MQQAPLYSLSNIRDAASKGNLCPGSGAATDMLDMGYSVEEVCEVISNLEDAEFFKSIPYSDENTRQDIACDVYKTNYKKDNHKSSLLYLKLRLSGGNWIFLASFKPI